MYIEKRIIEICRTPYNLSHTSGFTGWRKCSISELLAWAWMGLFAYWGKCHWSIGYTPPVNHPESGVAACSASESWMGGCKGEPSCCGQEWLRVLPIKYKFVEAFSLLDSVPLRESQPLTIKPYLIKIQDKIFEWDFFVLFFSNMSFLIVEFSSHIEMITVLILPHTEFSPYSYWRFQRCGKLSFYYLLSN